MEYEPESRFTEELLKFWESLQESKAREPPLIIRLCRKGVTFQSPTATFRGTLSQKGSDGGRTENDSSANELGRS